MMWCTLQCGNQLAEKSGQLLSKKMKFNMKLSTINILSDYSN